MAAGQASDAAPTTVTDLATEPATEPPTDVARGSATDPATDAAGDAATDPGSEPASATASSTARASATDGLTEARLRRARLGIAGTFALAGALCAVWTVRVPALKDKLGVSDGQLGLVVLAFGIGGIVSMSLMGRLVARHGSRRLLRATVPLCVLAVAGIGLSPNLAAIIGAGLAFGLVFGVTEVAMNTQASLLEQRYGRSLMAGMHAGWSIGAVTGGLFGALAARCGLGFTPSVVIAAALGAPAAVWLRGTYLPDAPAGRGEAAASGGAGADGAGRASGGMRLPWAVYVAGAIIFCAFMVEGAVADWSGLYLRDTLGSPEAVAALAYPLYEAAMATGRLTGDRVTNRLGARAVLIMSGAATACGLTIALLAGGTALGLVGFFVVGVGVCLVVPVAFSVGGALGGAGDPARAGTAIARIGAMGYTGLLLGPVLIGFVADASTLRIGLTVTVALSLAIAAGARLLPGGRHLGKDAAAASRG
ncbi:MFS transporter [Yinghuangia seranimata]|uniref:MFS transporter n=1 Tax=Yinghuangia seranimata TaxID=408067 RepID=UPI00248CDDC8|nr:MFS transporter [Yinghuangia seranimata]MDI2126470.1 MFS transporter [Yinghuangia seranimata]